MAVRVAIGGKERSQTVVFSAGQYFEVKEGAFLEIYNNNELIAVVAPLTWIYVELTNLNPDDIQESTA